ncbi:hypothetical protein ONE63_002501 [Megalurothrips usitatus]|uniref:Transcription factor cwo n=1 Tax=Megalurothrips usitatus TaxID=439358 RepID=A0AAV7X8D0_9NEOP|nr:hypothetical protein ONE63_002501 [Megalurothrips usitatus]
MVTESPPPQERLPLLPRPAPHPRSHHHHLDLDLRHDMEPVLRHAALRRPMPLPLQMSARREPRETREREDPMSHRIIEKRRRDRMNNCLADLSRLIPAEYLKKGRGRVEKTEIIEMAIKHMQYLQSRANLAAGIECGGAEGPAAGLPGDLRVTKCEQSQSPVSDRAEATSLPENASTPPTPPPADAALRPVVRPIVTEHYRLGYQECLSEAMHFLVEVEGYFAGDSLCVKLISHLQKHCDKIVKGDRLNVPRTRQPGEATSSSGSSSSYGATGNGNGASSGDSGVVVASKGPGPPSSSPHDAAARVHPAQLQQLPQHPHPHSYPHGLAASHLRDILCASPPSPQYHHPLAHHGLPQHYDPCTDADGLGGHDPHDGGPHPDPNHHYADPHHQHNSYKFKNTIQQRFSEEHGNGSSNTAAATPSASASASHPSQPSSQHTVASVPIFVLHARGAFYIPLSVSYEVLAPYLDVDLFSDPGSGRSACATMTQVPPGVVLHPVTISVNFQQYVKQQPLPAQSQGPRPHPAPHPALPAHALQPWSAGLGHARTDAVGFVPASPWELSARH